MDLEDFCYATNIDTVNSILPNWRQNLGSKMSNLTGIRLCTLPPEEWPLIFHESWIEQMNTHWATQPNICVIFDRDPLFNNYESHRDVDPLTGRTQHYTFNILSDPDPDSELVWYDNPAKASPARFVTNGVTIYGDLSFHLPDTSIIARHGLPDQKLYLCRTDITHTVIMGQRPRTCFSIKFPDVTNTWTDAVKMYSHILKKD